MPKGEQRLQAPVQAGRRPRGIPIEEGSVATPGSGVGPERKSGENKAGHPS